VDGTGTDPAGDPDANRGSECDVGAGRGLAGDAGAGRGLAGGGPAGTGAGARADGRVSATAPTIYDVARVAGVSIASVSRVLNGQRNPRQETRERVLAAVAELGFAPDGAARALSGQLREVVGVIVRRPWRLDADDLFADESDSLQYST